MLVSQKPPIVDMRDSSHDQRADRLACGIAFANPYAQKYTRIESRHGEFFYQSLQAQERQFNVLMKRAFEGRCRRSQARERLPRGHDM
jgi:hypothetical protein